MVWQAVVPLCMDIGQKCTGPERTWPREQRVPRVQHDLWESDRGCQARRHLHTPEGASLSSLLSRTALQTASKPVTLLTKGTRRGRRCSWAAGVVVEAVPASSQPHPHASPTSPPKLDLHAPPLPSAQTFHSRRQCPHNLSDLGGVTLMATLSEGERRDTNR